MSDQPPPDNQPTASINPGCGDGAAPPAFAMEMTRASLGECAGDWIGPHLLLEVIGEGGFGVVWLAERREPMVQRVALKIVKPGMDSRAVIARFEQERQALAVMDHPNVARILDGGVTPKGRPYFVMEYVKGEPITEYCDHRRLTLRHRLEIFIPVCEAVQHAHHKGLIHRDIKPSNVLVTEIEGRPVPKVIDFGVAKAITYEAWAHPGGTHEGMVIGTPEYMSPEQVAGTLDIDTRTDVYSLGVLLYELLTGELPFDTRELRQAGMEGIKQFVQNVTPPKPSSRLMQLAGDRTATIAALRSATRERIASELRRELEWVPLMALRKERERRYASPKALAEDVQRYIDGRPLLAAPDSRMYLTRKFVSRHRGTLAAVVLVAVSLVAGIVSTGIALQGQRLLRREAENRADRLAIGLARSTQTRRFTLSDAMFRGLQLPDISVHSALVRVFRIDDVGFHDESASAVSGREVHAITSGYSTDSSDKSHVAVVAESGECWLFELGDRDGAGAFRNYNTVVLVAHWSVGSFVRLASLSKNGRYFAVIRIDGRAVVFDTQAPSLELWSAEVPALAAGEEPESPSILVVSEDGEQIAVGYHLASSVRMLARTGGVTELRSPELFGVVSLDYSWNSDFIAASALQHVLVFRTGLSRSPVIVMPVPTCERRAMGFSQDSATVGFINGCTGKASYFDLATGQHVSPELKVGDQ